MKIFIRAWILFVVFNLFSIYPVFCQDTIKILNGIQKFYYKNGAISSEGLMKDGKPDGYWKSYNEEGKIKSEGNRKNFELDSLWKFYNEEGKLILEVNYRNGKKNGIKTTYLDKETIKENYRDDSKDGYGRYYYKDGKLKAEIPYVKGLEQGLAKDYSPEGEITMLTEYKRGFVIDRQKINRRDKFRFKQGKWFTFYTNGNIKEEGNYRDDKKDGYFKDYSENGDLISVTKYINDIKQEEAEEVTKLDIQNEYYPDGRIKATATYRNGVPEGIRREYNTTGTIIKSMIYKNGLVLGEGIVLEDGSKDGHWKEYYTDGSLRSEGEYRENKPVGEWKYYYPNGKMEQTGKYSNSGKLTGNWKWFYDNEQLKVEESYIAGLKEGTHIEYDETGKIIENGEYVKGLEDGEWFTISGDFIERGFYRDGLKNGKWSSYYLVNNGVKTDSTVSFTGSFVDDNPDGKHVYYWDNGKVRTEGPYVMGKKEGDWIIYNYDGTPFLVITYKNGSEIKYDGFKIKPPFESEEN
jgi:uncharacterized protein